VILAKRAKPRSLLYDVTIRSRLQRIGVISTCAAGGCPRPGRLSIRRAAKPVCGHHPTLVDALWTARAYSAVRACDRTRHRTSPLSTYSEPAYILI
jgi:hypothetical protein